MSLAVPNQLNKADLSLNSSISFNDMRLPHALTSSTQRLGIDIDPNSEQVEPLIAKLNQRGLKSIAENDYNQAMQFFQEAQNLLQLVAGCGKSIDRQLILTILTNEAYVFHEEGKLDLAKRYLEAVIYNINAYLQHSAQLSMSVQLQRYLEGSSNREEMQGWMQQQWSGLNTLINRTRQLSVAQLQYAALLAENFQHVGAALMAQKSISSIITHLKYSKIYCNYLSETNQIFRQIVQEDFMYQQLLKSLDFEQLHQQINNMIENPLVIQVLEQQQTNWTNKLEIADFIRLKPQSYTRLQPWEVNDNLQGQYSRLCVLEKYLHMGCGYLMVGSSKMKQLNQTQYFMGTTSQYEKQREYELREAEINYLLSIKIVLKYLPKQSCIATEFIEAFRSRMNQEYKIRVIEAAQHKAIHQSNKRNNPSQQPQVFNSDPNLSDIKVSDKLMPPSVDPFMMDLSSADSIDLQSNASMIDVLRQADTASKTDEDQEVYFQFMPKKTMSSNPLFQATANLHQLKKQVGLRKSRREGIFQVSLERIVQENTNKQASKIKIGVKINKLRDRHYQSKNKGDSKQKQLKSKSKPKYLISQCPSHYASVQKIPHNTPGLKRRSKARNPESISERLLTQKIKPDKISKKETNDQSKMARDKIIKINKIKSGIPNPKMKRQGMVWEKNSNVKAKSRSQAKSIKNIKSKSKSGSHKGFNQKKSEKCENIYLIKKK